MQAVRPAGDGPLKAPRQYIKSKRRRATAICTDGSLKSECVLVCVLTDYGGVLSCVVCFYRFELAHTPYFNLYFTSCIRILPKGNEFCFLLHLFGRIRFPVAEFE